MPNLSALKKIIQQVSNSPSFAPKWENISRCREGYPLVFNHVAPAATGFLCAACILHILEELKGSLAPSTRSLFPFPSFWIVTPHLKAQERLSQELLLWFADEKVTPECIFLPEQEQLTEQSELPDPDILAERLSIFQRLSVPAKSPRFILLTQEALNQAAPSSQILSRQESTLKVGGALNEQAFEESLINAGFERVPQVIGRLQWAKRGGIIDFFPPQASYPIRVELFDDEIDSLREFDLDSQISIQKLSTVHYLLAEPSSDVSLREWIRPDDYLIATPYSTPEQAHIVLTEGLFIPEHHEPLSLAPSTKGEIDKFIEDSEEDYSTACMPAPLGFFEAGDFVLQETKRTWATKQIQQWIKDKWKVFLFLGNEGETKRFQDMLPRSAPSKSSSQKINAEKTSTTKSLERQVNSEVETEVQETSDSPPLLAPVWKKMSLVEQPLPSGFSIPSAKLVILSSAELFGRYQSLGLNRAQKKEQRARQARAQLSLREIHEGDYVVHLNHGIGRFIGLAKDEKTQEEMLSLQYKDHVILHVPLRQSHLVSRYIGLGKKTPELNKLGDGRWVKSWQSAERAVTDYAAQLLSIQANRETQVGYAHPVDTRWMWEFESSFPFRETEDQLAAIQETKKDMEKPRAMDRLICGDVGFGKTEVAIRAAFKCVTGGKQALLLAPTTVLAEQHFRTFKSRMSEYPIRIELLNRFRSTSEQNRTLQGLANGSVDIVIGTHRLISNDVIVKNPGLVIIDEEQRFGVKHKEKFKERFHALDILTLSATPIPRTLYLALMGARDMSTIDTPPSNRLPVHTSVCSYDERLIKRVIERELARGGQVYFLHNRVKTIESVREHLSELIPSARIIVGHGQMERTELEEVMHTFVQGEADILLATTIIESGIDIPNANTIIIDRADRFGLADLYQLRGRVGRAGHQAYAYLLLPHRSITTSDARKRINAIKQYTELGSGFKIAMRDLEIRGAGNLLGTKQSGHIAAIGFDLYCQLLQQSIEQAKGHKVRQRVDCTLRAPFLLDNELTYAKAKQDGLGKMVIGLFIPSLYISETSLRMAAYKDLALAQNMKEVKKIASQWKDRFGAIPPPAENLLLCQQIKITAQKEQITHIEIQGQHLKLMRNGQWITFDKTWPTLKTRTPLQQLKETLEFLQGP